MLALGLAATTKHLALPEEGVLQQHTQAASRPSSICYLAPSCSISVLTSTANALIKKQGTPTAGMPCNAIASNLKQHRVTSLKPARQIHLLSVGLQPFQDLLHAMLLVRLPFEGLG